MFVGFVVGLEIERVTELFRLREHMGAGAVALYIIILTVSVIEDVNHVHFGVCDRIHDVPLRNLFGNLRHAVVLYTQMENITYRLGGFFIHAPVQLVFRVFDIPVWRIRANRLSRLSLCFENGSYLWRRIR